MSGLTLVQLLEADAAPFARAAQAWAGLAEDLDNAAEQLIRGTRDLGYAWPEGDASEAAQARTAQLRAEVSNAYNPARRIAQALRAHADSMAQLKGLAQAIVEDARGAGFSVDPAAGTVTAPAHMYQNGAPEQTAYRVTAVVNELSGVLERARGLDDSTTNTINVNLPDASTGFGALNLPPISRQDLENQRGRTPAQVHDWWLNLTPEQQEQAIRDHPDLVGWMDGVPATDRDTADRISLDKHQGDLQRREDDINRQLAELRRQLGAGEGDWRVLDAKIHDLEDEQRRIDAKQASLANVDQALTKLGGQGLLLGIDPAGDGKAIIAVGNPDTARHTAVWVPGLGTTMDSTRGNVDRVLHLQQAADQLTPGQPGDVATVMWLGYDAPEVSMSVVTDERSKQGAGPLSRFVDGLHATHDGGAYHVTAVGHSYGSTVVAEASLRGTLRVGDIVTAGSPGMHTDHARNFANVDPQHVWAGSAAGDPVSDARGHPIAVGAGASGPSMVSGAAAGVVWAMEHGHGESPHRESFGANRYVVDTYGHSDYWSTGTDSLDNQARVVVGQYSRVGLHHGERPQDLP